MSDLEKPFWMKPPHNILFDLLRLHRIRPWDVDISNILNSFLSEMKTRGYIDFSASGTALLSSSIIYRMKSELVLKMEEPPKPPAQRLQEEVPPPLPIRFEYTTISISEILAAIEEVLKSELKLMDKAMRELTLTPVPESLDDFITNIQEHLDRLYMKLIQDYGEDGEISFRVLTANMSMQDFVRTFILILFLASKERISLTQDESYSDIKIKVLKYDGAGGKVRRP
ncbi:MAG: segregation/condensation protein A [Candidatus Bathyarchaeia archaeon]